MLLSLRARWDTGSTEQLVPTTLGPGGILFLWSRCIVREEGVGVFGVLGTGPSQPARASL
jgi:hypothetical protein